jgi:hypothetical protein
MANPLDALRALKPGNSPPSSQAPSDFSEGSNLEDQASAGYMPPEDGPFECDHCAHFQAPNTCDKVSGVIDPQGCCNYYLSVETGSENPGGGVGKEAPIPSGPEKGSVTSNAPLFGG